jgi:diacylglycerol O-acyltransferase
VPEGTGPGDRVPRATLPLLAARTRLTAMITHRRRYTFGSVSMASIRKVKAAFDCTVNDAVLALCAQAVREWLIKHDALPEQPLVAAGPMSIRRQDDDGRSASQVVFARVNLATDLAAPAKAASSTPMATAMRTRFRR